jgi:hypothetical protein
MEAIFPLGISDATPRSLSTERNHNKNQASLQQFPHLIAGLSEPVPYYPYVALCTLLNLISPAHAVPTYMLGDAHMYISTLVGLQKWKWAAFSVYFLLTLKKQPLFFLVQFISICILKLT